MDGFEANERVNEEAKIARLRAEMDTACGLLADSHQSLKDRCNAFEALLDAPDRSLPAIRQAQSIVRAAGMQSIGLTTSYLASLSTYMRLLDA